MQNEDGRAHREFRERLNALVTDERCDAARMELTDAMLREFERNCADLPAQAAYAVTVAGFIKAAVLAWMTMPPRAGTSERRMQKALHTVIDGDWKDLREASAGFSLWPTIFSDAAPTPTPGGHHDQ